MDDGTPEARLRTIRRLDRAAEDLYRIVVRLEERNPTYAQRVYQAIQSTANNLAYFPTLGKSGRIK